MNRRIGKWLVLSSCWSLMLLDGQPARVAVRVEADKEYPPSPVISEVRWAPLDRIIRLAPGSDNWPMTWATVDSLYTAYGDGWGFTPRIPEKLSLGFARITGAPPDLQGTNIRSASGEQKGDGKAGKKASGIVMVDSVLYLWVRNAENSQLAWSVDLGRTWTWSEWKFATSFGCPTFLNFGKNNTGARDGYVYTYSLDADSAYTPSDRMVLARVPRERIKERDSYEFFRGMDAEKGPLWTRHIEQRGAVFTRAGKCYRSGVSYNAGLKRYLWCQTLPHGDKTMTYGLAIFDAPEPWGPWTRVFLADPWDVDAGETCSFPTKWISADGKTLHLVFASKDSFSVRQVTFGVRTR